ncbi:MAG: LPS assembly lipoprotein LptE [Pannonibacter sp.]
MSLADAWARGRRTSFGIALVLASGVLLAGCQVRPLYGQLPTPAGVAGETVQGELAAIEIEKIDTVNEMRLSDARRVLYNELTFGFERGGYAPAKKYRLRMVMNIGVSEVGVERLADVPSAYSTTMNVSFVLSDAADNRTLMTGKSFATASYDFSSQRFANLRARRDAEERAAKVVAQDVQARIAGYFATRK